MAAFGSLRRRWAGSCVVLGTALVVRATRGICEGSLHNAEAGRTEARARLDEWASVLSLYDPLVAGPFDVPVTA